MPKSILTQLCTVGFFIVITGACTHSDGGGGGPPPADNQNSSPAPAPSPESSPSSGDGQKYDVDEIYRQQAKGNLFSIANLVESISTPDLSPDGTKLFAAVSAKDSAHYRAVKIWDATNGKLIKYVGDQSIHTQDIFMVAMSPNGKMIATTCGDKNIRIFDYETGAILQTIPAPADTLYSSLKFLDDDHILIDHEIQSVITMTKNASGLFESSKDMSSRNGSFHFSRVFDPLLIMNSDHTKMVDITEHSFRTIEIGQATEMQSLQTFDGHKEAVYSVAFHPSGNELASGSRDQTVKIWDAKSAACTRTIQADHAIVAVAYSPDGKYLIGADSEDAYIWRHDTGELVRKLASNKSEAVESKVVFSPDGSRAYHLSISTFVVYDTRDLKN